MLVTASAWICITRAAETMFLLQMLLFRVTLRSAHAGADAIDE